MFKMMSGFPREKIDIVKQNGKKLCQIDALIGDSTALIEDTTIVIEENDYTVLLPKFDFSAIKGAVNPTQISLKLDNDNIDELKVRLGELKDIISNEFGISVPSNRWEKKRDTFISTINSLMTEGD